MSASLYIDFGEQGTAQVLLLFCSGKPLEAVLLD